MGKVNTWWGACQRKVRHESRQSAEGAAQIMARGNLREHGRPDISVYRCVLCDGYHIGRPSKRGHG